MSALYTTIDDLADLGPKADNLLVEMVAVPRGGVSLTASSKSNKLSKFGR